MARKLGWLEALLRLFFPKRRFETPPRETPPPPPAPREPPPARDAAPAPTPPEPPPPQPAPAEPRPAEPPPLAPPAPTHVWTDGRDPAIPAERQHRGNFSPRSPGAKVRRVIVHVTGTVDMAAVTRQFTEGNTSAHYVIEPGGQLHQFVSEDHAAWHSGIKKHVHALYKKGDGSWRRYTAYFHWYQGIPADALFYDKALKQVPRPNPPAAGKAAFVGRGDGKEWGDYAYFDRRFGRAAFPLGYEPDKNPNDDSIGIEIVSVGDKVANVRRYTPAMYRTLKPLIEGICARHGLEPVYGVVCGHEDVNPVERWGWDPNAGFEWDKVVKIPGAGV
jgi:N-acetyl-anhydromuramyl-L-alanine amidase AmpD